jgi:murein DD-endopeptidase MepM/ murein hydrolase activator NlpD
MVDINHDNGLTTRYAHLSKMLVKVGDIVLKGQHIGDLGSTGRATGPHLHFEVRENSVPISPKRFLNFARAQEPAVATKSARAP